jgi:hypothetical protein
MAAQGEAAGRLEAEAADQAVPPQQTAAAKIREAVEELTKGEGRNRQQEQQAERHPQQPQEQEPEQEGRDRQMQQERERRSETARGIIDEEKENRKKRRDQGSEGYRKVDKDW